jgi:hypothetical protein
MISNYHIASHDYYSLPLVPLAALSLGALGGVTVRGLAEQAERSEWRRWLIRLTLLFVVVLTFWESRVRLLAMDYRPQAAFWAEVGEALDHQPSVIAVTQDYGYPLVYWGWQKVTLWPEARSEVFGARAGDLATRFERLTRGKIYFLVTDFEELRRQAGLEDYLRGHFPVHAEGEGYVIFDLTQPLKH